MGWWGKMLENSKTSQAKLERMKHWYCDNTLTMHIESYKSEGDANREMEVAMQNGWKVEETTGIAGHINLGRTVAGAALTGGVSLLFGGSRSKDKITVRYGRIPNHLSVYATLSKQQQKQQRYTFIPLPVGVTR